MKTSLVKTYKLSALLEICIFIFLIIIGGYYGIFALAGFKVFDVGNGWISMGSSMAIFNMFLALLIFLYLKNYDNIHNKKKHVKSLSNEYLRIGLYTLAFIECFYYGFYSLAGYKTYIKYEGFQLAYSYEAIMHLLISCTIFLYLTRSNRSHESLE